MLSTLAESLMLPSAWLLSRLSRATIAAARQLRHWQQSAVQRLCQWRRRQGQSRKPTALVDSGAEAMIRVPLLPLTPSLPHSAVADTLPI